jgi:hypothetical protein
VERYALPEDWSKVDRYEDHFYDTNEGAESIDFRSDEGKWKDPEPVDEILKRTRKERRYDPKWILADFTDRFDTLEITVYLGDAMRRVLVNPYAGLQNVADEFGLGTLRGTRVEPSKAYQSGRWCNVKESIQVWLVGSKPDDRCWLRVTENGRKYDVQVRRDRPIAEIM